MRWMPWLDPAHESNERLPRKDSTARRCALAEGSLRTSTRTESERDLPAG